MTTFTNFDRRAQQWARQVRDNPNLALRLLVASIDDFAVLHGDNSKLRHLYELADKKHRLMFARIGETVGFGFLESKSPDDPARMLVTVTGGVGKAGWNGGAGMDMLRAFAMIGTSIFANAVKDAFPSAVEEKKKADREAKKEAEAVAEAETFRNAIAEAEKRGAAAFAGSMGDSESLAWEWFASLPLDKMQAFADRASAEIIRKSHDDAVIVSEKQDQATGKQRKAA